MLESRIFWLALLLVAGYLLYLLSPVLTPFIISALLAYLGDQLCDRLEARKMSRTLAVTTVFATLVLIFGAGGLRLLLRPLHRIEEQAEKLSRRQYTFQEQLPRTRELRSVVVAMNTMTSKVKEMFDEQAGVADRLRKNAYTDELTGLGNRRYLQGQVAALAGEGNDLVAGALLLIQACDLQEINRKKGFQYGDQLLQRIAEKLRETTGHLHRAALAHLSGGTFAILLTDVSHAESKRIAKKLADDLASLADEGEGLAGNIGHVGGVSFVNATSFGQLLAEADAGQPAQRLVGTGHKAMMIAGDSISTRRVRSPTAAIMVAASASAGRKRVVTSRAA